MVFFFFLYFSGENGRIEYELVSEYKEVGFIIDPKNGTIFTSRLLDRETCSFYNLAVLAKDKAKSPHQRLSATVQVYKFIYTINNVKKKIRGWDSMLKGVSGD